MGDTMTREQIEAVAHEYEEKARSAQRQIDMSQNPESERHRFKGRRDALQLAARMLRDALAESELAEGGSFICLACSARGHSPEDIKHADRCPYKVAL